MRVYLDSGYLNVRGILSQNTPFNFVTGGRGTGKTYGALQYAYESGRKFIYMRRSQTQVDMVSNPQFQPFKTLNDDFGWQVGVSGITKNCYGFYDMIESQDGGLVCAGEPIGYALALSTFSNLRGFDASDVELLIFDEFIPERHEKPIKDEAAAFLNCVETINRNRELKGCDPVKVLALSNSNNLACSLFIYLGLVSKVVKMQERGQEFSLMPDRGIGLYILNHSPISEAKRQTALYKLTCGTAFERMAISNDFTDYSNDDVRSCSLKEVKPLVNVGELTVCEFKGDSGKIYVTNRIIETAEKYASDTQGLKGFKLRYRWLYVLMIDKQVTFENPTCKVLLEKYFTQ